MRLAFVIFRYFPFGGLQRDMLAIAQAAQKNGHQISIFCGDWQGDKVPGIDVNEINGRGFFNIAGVKNFVDAFQKQFRRDQFDLLVGFNKMPGLDVYYCGDSCFAKKAYEERGFLYRLAPRSRLYLHYEESVYSHASKTRILEVSADERRVFAKYYATPEDRQTLLPPGIDPKLTLSIEQRTTLRASIRAELNVAANDYLILCVGSGFKTKGLDRSISCFAEFRKANPGAALAVIGNGDPRPFKALIDALGVGDAVKFLGGRNDMAGLYAAGDLLLHPAYKEVTGNVIVEAMVCALPVLVTPVCGYAHYVSDYAMGELVDVPDDPVLVSTKIEKLVKMGFQHWFIKAKLFVQEADIFSRPERAVSEIERVKSSRNFFQVTQSAADSTLILCDELVVVWQHEDVFSLMENIQGEIAREMKDRQTLRFEINGQGYYRKWHRGVGWKEILKNLLQLRLPVLGATNEWRALNKLNALQIPSLIPLAYGMRGRNPAQQQSFIVTRELTDVIQLDHYFERSSVAIKDRRSILLNLAKMVRQLHSAGINHRDLYLCHCMLKPESLIAGGQPELYLIDLHRAQCRVEVPLRWLIKDLAALYYSSLNLGFSQRESLRFLRVYFNGPLRHILREQASLLNKVHRRALKIYLRDYGREPHYIH